MTKEPDWITKLTEIKTLKELLSKQKDIPSEIAKVVDDNFLDLI